MAQLDVHDADAAQLPHMQTKRSGHQSDLPVESLRQDDAKTELVVFVCFARKRHLSVNFHAAHHATQELIIDRVIHFGQIFLLVLVFRAQDFVDDVAVAGQQDQPFRILVEPANRKDAARMIDTVDDVAVHVFFSSTGDANRFVKRNVDMFLAALAHGWHDFRAIDLHERTLRQLDAYAGKFTVDGDPSFADQPVRLAPRAETTFAEVFVQTHRGISQGEPGRMLQTLHGRISSSVRPLAPLGMAMPSIVASVGAISCTAAAA